ncbi:MAG: lysozyme family protein [Clostridiales bacterium]|nr:lysozyme family protein [Clostridiales bacterium]
MNTDHEARAEQPAPAKLPREQQTTEENRFRVKERSCHRTIREKEQSSAYLPKERSPIPDAPRTEPQAPPVSSASAFATERAAQQTAQRAAQQARKASQTAAKTASATGQAARSAGDAVRRTAAAARTELDQSQSLSVVIDVGGGVVVAILLVVLLFGGAFSLVGGDNVSSVLPVSEEVEAYEPVIRLYAEEYGVADYVELIMAIMMQESGGRGLDPMQASESGYNTRYPNTPGGITDPDYSIQCGVQVMRDVLERAGVESPVDMERIRLALQGYNFGPGYITWAVRHYGGYSLANAAEFSAMMAEHLGWDGYGDTQYVPHVLRYYVFGRFGTGEGNEALVAVALSQEGNSGETYWRWFGFDSRVDWCACFVSWCADQCGLIDAGTVPKFSLCTDGAAWFADQGRLMDGSYIPSAGDIIFFDWGGDGSADHVGIVESVSGGRVYTVEGNSGDTVRRKDYALGGTAILGFGVLGQ